jgi:hypothetical protein
MAAWTDRSVFYHVPKTGGVWVKEAMRRGGLRYGRCRNRRMHHPFGLKREHATPEVVVEADKTGRFSFCFVRHPEAWYRSFWAYRAKTGWLDGKFPADRCWDDLYDAFVDNVTEVYPLGFVSTLYQFYVNDVTFVGRQESLADDLVRALTMAGEEFDEEKLRAVGLRNVAGEWPKWQETCRLSAGTRGRMLWAERWALERFYGGIEGSH